MNDIFDRSWKDIQAMQQGTYTPQAIDISKPAKKPASDNDKALLSKHGINGLKKLGYFGVLDRLNVDQ